MTDAFLTEFWALADPPWSRLGPEFAALLKCATEQEEPNRLVRWGRVLREERCKRGLTQRKVAASAGIGQAHISDIELAQAGVGDAHWGKLAAFYGITLE